MKQFLEEPASTMQLKKRKRELKLEYKSQVSVLGKKAQEIFDSEKKPAAAEERLILRVSQQKRSSEF